MPANSARRVQPNAQVTLSEASPAVVVRLRAEARRAARAAGLCYADHGRPGFGRARRGKHFSYQDQRGRAIRDAATISRIKSLAIPPAWTEVWICPDPLGHVQATGRDARGRKQYRYHARWAAHRTQSKHARICEFARELPVIRATCNDALRRPGLSRDTVLAALLRIVDITAMRVGNEEYARQNASFGLTTLRCRHARLRGPQVELRFRGKSGIWRDVRFRNARLARIIRDCKALRGRQLFHYLDESGTPHPVHAKHLNAYLRSLTAVKYSVKDFRTWAATVDVAVELRRLGPVPSQRAAKKVIAEAICKAAEFLGNTPAVCRNSYVHPAVLEAYRAGHTLPPRVGPRGARARSSVRRSREERGVLAFLEALEESGRAAADAKGAQARRISAS